MNIIPKEFDWVSARATCSLIGMFTEIKAGIERDVNKRNEIEKAGQSRQFFNCKNNGNTFSVFTEASAVTVILEFKLDKNSISVYRNGTEFIRATVTLTNECECKLLANKDELYPWQFRRMALEAILFGDL